jgi:hypothetical protein
MHPITTWPTRKVAGQHPASGEAGDLGALTSGVIMHDAGSSATPMEESGPREP